MALLRRDAVVEVGAWDVSFPLVEDWELYLRLARRGPLVALDRQVAWYRRHAANLTRKHEELYFHVERLRHGAWSSPANDATQREAAARAWRLLEARQVLTLGRHAVRSAARGRWSSAGEAAVGVVVSSVLVLRRTPPRAARWRSRFTRPDDHLDVPL